MKRLFLSLPRNYVPVFDGVIRKLEGSSSGIFYIYSPLGFGKSTTILRFLKEGGFRYIFIELESRDKNISFRNFSFLRVLSSSFSYFRELFDVYKCEVDKVSLRDILENISGDFFKDTWFVFSEVQSIGSGIEEFINEFIYPLGETLRTRIILESVARVEFSQNMEVFGPEYFKLEEEDIKRIAMYFGVEVDTSTAYLVKERTEGWIVPVISLFSRGEISVDDIKRLEGSERVFMDFWGGSFNELSVEYKNIVLGLGQLREFDISSVRWILGYDNPEEIIRKLQKKGFILIEENREGNIVYHFHRLLRRWIEEKLESYPYGKRISIRINLRAMEYYENLMDFENALYYAFRLRDFNKIGMYFKKIIPNLITEGRFFELEEYIKEIGEENMLANKDLTLCYAVYMRFLNKHKKAVEYIKKIYDQLDDDDKLLAMYVMLEERSYIERDKGVLIKDTYALIKEIRNYEDKIKEGYGEGRDLIRIAFSPDFNYHEYFVNLMYGRAYNLLGRLYVYQRKYELAKDFFKKSLKYIEKLKDPYRIAILLYNIGVAELNSGNKEAMDYFKRVVSYPYDVPLKSSSFSNLGLCYEIFMGDLNKAEYFYKKAFEIAKKFNQIDRLVDDGMNLLIIYIKRGEREKAENIIKNVEKYLRECENIEFVNYFKLKRIEFILEFHDYEEAERELRDFEEGDIEKELKPMVMGLRGKIEYLKGNRDEGRKLIREAVEMFDNYIELLDFLFDKYVFYKKFNDSEKDNIRVLAKNIIENKGISERLKDFDF